MMEVTTGRMGMMRNIRGGDQEHEGGDNEHAGGDKEHSKGAEEHDGDNKEGSD